jgi:hypothetical protein
MPPPASCSVARSGRRSESDAEAQPGPEDALVEVARVPELIVVCYLGAHIDPLKQADVEADLGPYHEPVLHARSVDATKVGSEEGPHDAQIRCEIETHDRPAVHAVVLAVEAVEQALLERDATEEAGEEAVGELGSD